MTYALVKDGVVEEVGELPASGRRLDTGEWVMGLRDAPEELVEACGWFPLIEPPLPEENETGVHEASVEIVDGKPTVVWTERPKTQAELDARSRRDSAREKSLILKQAVPTLRQWADDAESTTVTPNNNIAVLNTVLDRLAIFFDRFADLLETQYSDNP